jgi:hypothetical protein
VIGHGGVVGGVLRQKMADCADAAGVGQGVVRRGTPPTTPP